MTLAQTDRSLPSPVEEAVGRMREYVVALKNTDRLLRSRSVGPKLLSTVLPEISALLPRLLEGVSFLADFVSHELGSDFSSLASHLEGGAHAIEEVIGSSQAEQLSAKSRLRLERTLDEYLGVLWASLEHIDLMVESTWAEGVSVSLGELLLSQPAPAEGARSRRITIRGDVHRAQIKLPARVASRALSLFVAELGVEDFLLGSNRDSHVLASLARSTADIDARGETFLLPNLERLPSSREACFAVFARYEVSCDFSAQRLDFPVAV